MAYMLGVRDANADENTITWEHSFVANRLSILTHGVAQGQAADQNRDRKSEVFS